MRKFSLLIAFLLFLQNASAQSLTVSGQITSADDGYPLPGVSVVIMGSTKGAFSDFDGNYSISVQNGQTLVFSSIGFQEHKETVTRGGR